MDPEKKAHLIAEFDERLSACYAHRNDEGEDKEAIDELIKALKEGKQKILEKLASQN